MTGINDLIKNLAIDIFIITSIFSVLNNPIYKLIFGTTYVFSKYL